MCFRLFENTSESEESVLSKPIKDPTIKNNSKINGTSFLHTLTLTDLEQYHAITERYRFAIPELETRCICECESASSNCLADDYKYGKCGPNSAESLPSIGTINDRREIGQDQSSPPSACYRTFFANQPSGTGCSTASVSPRLCCHLRFRPYLRRSFTALRLEVATSSALLLYSVFAWQEVPGNGSSLDSERGEWLIIERRRIRVQLEGSIQNVVICDR